MVLGSLTCLGVSFHPLVAGRAQLDASTHFARNMAPMRDFYADKCLFITGSTGFVAKVILEKVLRSLPTVRRIYLLIRPLGGVTPEKRLAALGKTKVLLSKVQL